ncbi:positive regulator of sigma(E), RseC/MucC [Anaerotignum neopropionicum]|uniref:Positive regulator of sigma(E), RseC/MucC n=1 Tax=Anaerotignum neopropionicum TaxID=36847 RepID=A0A136WAY5_9FIRM|nr:SoxR reducing system RseC family protein [Anaerotignum neopropionicum]KXL51677.1 positive regulator of sigma(E), RseC/MucC [Anaerotignum neopropionicum]
MKGLVTKEDGNMLKVHIVRKEACGHCRACLSGMMENDMDIDARNLCDAEVGDWVELELQDNAFLYAVLISYGMPLIAFFIGLFVGYFVVSPFIPLPQSLVSFIFGAVCVLSCYAWIKSQNPRWEGGKYLPLAVRLTSEGYEV